MGAMHACMHGRRLAVVEERVVGVRDERPAGRMRKEACA